jgi:hypothetical protein
MYCTYKNFNSLCHYGKLLCPTSIPWSSHVGYLLYHGVEWHMIIRVVGISRDYERGIQSVHLSGARRAKKGPVKPWRATWRFILIFSFNFFFNSIPQFWEKFQSVPWAQSSLVPPCKISLEGPGDICVSWLSGFGNKLCGFCIKTRR